MFIALEDNLIYASLLDLFPCTLIIACFYHRREPSYKPHTAASTTSSFSTGASYTASSSYKPPSSGTTVEESTVADQSINDDTSNDDVI